MLVMRMLVYLVVETIEVPFQHVQIDRGSTLESPSPISILLKIRFIYGAMDLSNVVVPLNLILADF
jgi:hypothetical protein